MICSKCDKDMSDGHYHCAICQKDMSDGHVHDMSDFQQAKIRIINNDDN